MDIAHEFERLGPWVTKFEIDGVSTGGGFDASNDARIPQFFNAFPGTRSVLELGALEGGHSFALANGPGVERVVALEVRDENLARAEFIKNATGDQKVEFAMGNVEDCDLGRYGEFDAVFCSGILYHLPEPWALIEKCRRVSPRIFIWTQYCCEHEAKKTHGGHRGKWWKEGGWRDPLSGVSKWSFWLSMGSLVNVLTENGYRGITIIENNRDHPHGCAVTLAATAGD